jgi:hypothetical protein
MGALKGMIAEKEHSNFRAAYCEEEKRLIRHTLEASQN